MRRGHNACCAKCPLRPFCPSARAAREAVAPRKPNVDAHAAKAQRRLRRMPASAILPPGTMRPVKAVAQNPRFGWRGAGKRAMLNLPVATHEPAARRINRRRTVNNGVGGDGMTCTFCHERFGEGEAFFCLCPECTSRLAGVAPERAEYPWFIAAVRRALFGY